MGEFALIFIKFIAKNILMFFKMFLLRDFFVENLRHRRTMRGVFCLKFKHNESISFCDASRSRAMYRYILVFLSLLISPVWATVTYSPAATVKYVSDMALRSMCVLVNNSPDQDGVNMSYLLQTIDLCNAGTTSYGTGKYATNEWANTEAVDAAMQTLLNIPIFSMNIDTRNTSPLNADFNFKISAIGNFVVDWGDGTTFEMITKSDTTLTTYSHTYSSAGTYTVRLAGRSESYNVAENVAAISFYDASTNMQKNLVGISGSLGYIFPIVSETATGKPSFYQTFYNAENLIGIIPEELFAGITGAPKASMFEDTFNGCVGLIGDIPENLFVGIVGTPASSLFSGTFQGCSGLTDIPSALFAGIAGAPATSIFARTFQGCTGLNKTIPGDLFAGVTGAPAESMFKDTFNGCTGLTGISKGLFDGISGAPALCFQEHFKIAAVCRVSQQDYLEIFPAQRKMVCSIEHFITVLV